MVQPLRLGASAEVSAPSRREAWAVWAVENSLIFATTFIVVGEIFAAAYLIGVYSDETQSAFAAHTAAFFQIFLAIPAILVALGAFLPAAVIARRWLPWRGATFVLSPIVIAALWFLWLPVAAHGLKNAVFVLAVALGFALVVRRPPSLTGRS